MDLKGLGSLQNHTMLRPNTPFESAKLALSICFVCNEASFLFRHQNQTFHWSDNNTQPCFIKGSLKVADCDWSKYSFLIVDWLTVTRADYNQLIIVVAMQTTNSFSAAFTRQLSLSVHQLYRFIPSSFNYKPKE